MIQAPDSFHTSCPDGAANTRLFGVEVGSALAPSLTWI